MKTRIQAANEIHALQMSMEARPLSLSTVYNRIFKTAAGVWRLVGRGYDYTA